MNENMFGNLTVAEIKALRDMHHMGEGDELDSTRDGRFVTETLNLATACLNSEQTTPQPSPSPAVSSELLAAVKPFVALWEKWLSVDPDTDEDGQEYINLFQWLDDEIAVDKFAEMMRNLAKAAALKAGQSG